MGLVMQHGKLRGGGAALELYAENPSTPTAPSATGLNAVAIGSGSVSSSTDTFAVGNLTDATGFEALAVGHLAQATSNYSTAVGTRSVASAGGATAIGRLTDALGINSLAIGTNAQSLGEKATALTNSYASGPDSFAAAIANNTSTYGATGANSVAIGYLAKATGAKSVAISSNTYGGSATASGAGGVAIGDGPTASGIGSTSIGRGCTASGINAIAMGRDAQATNEAAVAIGYRAYSDVKGGIAFAGAGYFGSALGDAQGRMYILRVQTSDATATELGESLARIKVPTNGAVVFDGLITGLESGVNSYAGWKIEGMIVNDAGTTTLVNSAITVIHNTPSWGLALTADNTNNRLAITVTGEASHNIRWVANIRTVETIYA
jgi:trimeric autotransporter adhesin